MSEDADSAIDRELLTRAELALTQLNNRHGLEPAQSATLTAIRLRLEGVERATLEDLLVAGKDVGGKDVGGKDPLADAMRERPRTGPSFDDLVADVDTKPKKSLDDLL
jgi:hypothetical protein